MTRLMSQGLGDSDSQRSLLSFRHDRPEMQLARHFRCEPSGNGVQPYPSIGRVMNSPELMSRLSKGLEESSGPGLNVLIRLAHKDVFGVSPSEDEVRSIVKKVNEAFDLPQSTILGVAQGPGGGRWVSHSKDTKTQS
jgi:hypothetical protein